jgi:polyisoprenoid-binding protein YceI
MADRMKKILLLLITLLTYRAGHAQYKPVDQESSIRFIIGNFGFDVTGSFKGLRGMINFDPQHLANANFDVDVDANSIDTDNSLRDSHLRGDSYFDVKNHPRIRLVSTKIGMSKTGDFVITGKLTIKNTTQLISFPFSATPTADGYRFKGVFKIKRKDFDIGGTSTVSDELQVSLSIAAKKA